MSEKASCPKCGGYGSECFYEQRHRWCGWNCHVAHSVSLDVGYGGGATDATVTGLPESPTEEQMAAALACLVDACRALGLAPGVWSATALTTVNHERADEKSPWFGPDAPPPKTPALARACGVCRAAPGCSCTDTRPECAGRLLKKPHRER